MFLPAMPQVTHILTCRPAVAKTLVLNLDLEFFHKLDVASFSTMLLPSPDESVKLFWPFLHSLDYNRCKVSMALI